MRSLLKKARRAAAQRGQGMTEYIIIVAVIAVLSIAVVTKFGTNIRQLFFASSQEIVGEEGEVTNHADEGDVDKELTDL